MQEYDNCKHMNVLISSDSRYLNKYKTMLYSFKKHNSDFTVYFLNKSIHSWKMQRFKRYLNKKIGCNCVEIKMNNELYENAPITIKRFSVEAYSRLFAQFYLPDDIDRILYLDGDIVCNRNIEEIYFQDFNHKSVIASTDISEESFKRRYLNNIGLNIDDKHHYVNAGVLMLNIKKMRETTNIQYILDLMSRLKDKIEHLDQDILNVLYKDDIKYESQFFNYPVYWYVKSLNKEISDKIFFLHFVGPEKPWMIKSHIGLSYFWWDIEIERGNRVKYGLFLIVRRTYMFFRKIYFFMHKNVESN